MAESAGAGGRREWSAAQGAGPTEAGGGCQEALGGCMSREWGWLGEEAEKPGAWRGVPAPGRSIAGKWGLGAVGLGKQMDDAVVSGPSCM